MQSLDFENIGKRIQTVRKMKNLTQIQVAEYAEMSERSYAEIERGKVTNIKISTLVKICNVLHVTPNDLLVIENDQSGSQPLELLIERMKKCSPTGQEALYHVIEMLLNSMN